MNKRKTKKRIKKNLLRFVDLIQFLKINGESTNFNNIAIILLNAISIYFKLDTPIFAAVWNTKKNIFIRIENCNNKNIITLKFRNLFPLSFPFEKYFFNICEELYLQVNLKDIKILQIDLDQKGNNRKCVPPFSFNFPKNRTLFYYLENYKSNKEIFNIEIY